MGTWARRDSIALIQKGELERVSGRWDTHWEQWGERDRGLSITIPAPALLVCFKAELAFLFLKQHTDNMQIPQE